MNLEQFIAQQHAPQFTFTHAINLSWQGSELSVTFAEIDELQFNNLEIIFRYLNNDELINQYIINLLTAFSCLNRSGISFSGNLSLNRTLRLVGEEIEFHLQVQDDDAVFTAFPPLNNLVLLADYLNELLLPFSLLDENVLFSPLLIHRVEQLAERLADDNFFDHYGFNYATAWIHIQEQPH